MSATQGLGLFVAVVVVIVMSYLMTIYNTYK